LCDFVFKVNLWINIGYITGFTENEINSLDLHIRFMRDASNFSIEEIIGLGETILSSFWKGLDMT